jgi:hypothetical protein
VLCHFTTDQQSMGGEVSPPHWQYFDVSTIFDCGDSKVCLTLLFSKDGWFENLSFSLFAIGTFSSEICLLVSFAYCLIGVFVVTGF